MSEDLVLSEDQVFVNLDLIRGAETVKESLEARGRVFMAYRALLARSQREREELEKYKVHADKYATPGLWQPFEGVSGDKVPVLGFIVTPDEGTGIRALVAEHAAITAKAKELEMEIEVKYERP